MHPDPDDPSLGHDAFVARVPLWAVRTAPGRWIARRRITATIRRHLADTGYTQAGPLCFHFGTIAGHTAVVAHFTARDDLATAYTASETPR